MTSKQLYDHICTVLTDYEGNGGYPATELDLYELLVYIQNNFDTINMERSLKQNYRSWMNATIKVD